MARKSILRPAILTVLLSLTTAAAFGTQVYNDSPITGIQWTLDTTRGFQNMMMSMEGGNEHKTSSLLDFSGILFHEYFKKIPVIKTQLNMGFSEHPDFLWSNNPDFYKQSSLSRTLECIELDSQFRLPFNFGHSNFYPFAGYSFLSYNNEDKNVSYKFQTVSAGVQYYKRVNSYISHNYYFSFTPKLINTKFKIDPKLVTYVNYGTEIAVNVYPLAVKMFVGIRSNKTFASANIGVSSSVKLK